MRAQPSCKRAKWIADKDYRHPRLALRKRRIIPRCECLGFVGGI